MSDVSSTRLYLGNLPRNATRADVENHFAQHGNGKITEIKLMNGFGFIEYEDAMDARDVVPAFHGTDFMGERLVVQFARGPRGRTDPFPQNERPVPRPRRTQFRMSITGLPTDTSWQDLKDFARGSGLDVVYSEVSRERNGSGFVEYETMADLRTAVDKLDNSTFREHTVRCTADPQDERPSNPPRERSGRSRSPARYPPRASYPPGPADPYDEYARGRAPRAYSPRGGREDYRRRSPPPREYYERGYRSPPRGGPPEDYRRYPDPYADPRGPPPPRRGGYEPEPYANGHGRAPYANGPPSPRRRSPVRGPAYDAGYERQRYW